MSTGVRKLPAFRWSLRLLWAFLLLVALSIVPFVSPVGAVQFGTVDEDHPYVGLLVQYLEQEGELVPFSRCSGTLIDERVFLTAAHCVYEADLSTEAEGGPVQVWFGQTVDGGYPFTGGVTGTAFPHPRYDNFAGFPATYDVAVVILDSAVSMDQYGELAEVNTLEELVPQRGPEYPTFTIVGYGLQGVKPVYSAERTRYEGTVMLVNLRSSLTNGYNVQVSANPGNYSGGACFGDSGGPLLLGDTNIVTGVASFVLNQNCRGSGFYYRVDIPSSLSFINWVIGEHL